jgi:hypothetical protein
LACPDCRLVLDTIVTLGEERIAPLIYPASVVHGRNGEWLAAPIAQVGAIAVFDSTGQPLRVVGRAGDGPGEYRDVERLFQISGETIAVVQERNRIDLIDAVGAWQRKVQLPAEAVPTHITAVNSARWFLATPYDGYNHRLYLLGPDSLSVVIRQKPRGPAIFYRVANAGSYVIVIQTAGVEALVLDTLGVIQSSYPLRYPVDSKTEFHFAEPVIRHDTLFTRLVRRRPSPKRSAPSPTAEPAKPGAPDVFQIADAWEDFLDVRHARSGEPIAFIQLPFVAGPFVDPDRMTIYSQDSLAVRLHVVRFGLQAR